MAEDNKRDIFRPLTPPPNVRAQTAAGSIAEAFEEEMTPVEGDTVTQIRKRSEQSAASAKGAFAAIREVRKEMHDSVERVDKKVEKVDSKIEKVDGKVDELNRIVGDMRSDVGEVLGKVGILVTMADTNAKAMAETAVIKVKADADVAAHKEKAGVDEVKSKNEFTRKGALQLLGILATVAGAVATAYAAGSGCFSG